MSGINSISGITPPIRPAQTSPASGASSISSGVGSADEAGKGNFSDMLTRCINRVDADQGVSADAVRQLLTGQSDDPLGVITSVARADMSFKLLIGVRNKMIEAYKQTMNMQI